MSRCRQRKGGDLIRFSKRPVGGGILYDSQEVKTGGGKSDGGDLIGFSNADQKARGDREAWDLI